MRLLRACQHRMVCMAAFAGLLFYALFGSSAPVCDGTQFNGGGRGRRCGAVGGHIRIG